MLVHSKHLLLLARLAQFSLIDALLKVIACVSIGWPRWLAVFGVGSAIQ